MLIKWVKRRAVIEQLYGKDYICPCCGKISIKENLEAFDFHHTNKALFNKNNKKTDFKKAFDTISVSEIIERLIKEECIYICANCHSLEKTKHFEANVERIIGKGHVKQVKEYHKKLYEGIRNSREKIVQIKKLLLSNQFEIRDTLKLMVNKFKNIWKKYIVQIYLIYETKDKSFTSLNIAELLGYNIGWFNKAKLKLLNRGLISVETTNNNYKYQLTEKGIIIAKNTIKDWKENHTKEYMKFIKKFNKRIKT